MTGTKDGVQSGLEAALEQYGDADPVTKAEQLALLPLPLDGETETEAQAARRTGRPKGSKGKRTEAWQAWLLSSYRSPLEMMAQAMTMRTADLAKQLECDLLEAFKLQIMAAKELAPYLHQKMPTAVDLTGAPPVSLTIHNSGSTEAAGSQARQGDGALLIGAKVLPVEDEENQ